MLPCTQMAQRVGSLTVYLDPDPSGSPTAPIVVYALATPDRPRNDAFVVVIVQRRAILAGPIGAIMLPCTPRVLSSTVRHLGGFLRGDLDKPWWLVAPVIDLHAGDASTINLYRVVNAALFAARNGGQLCLSSGREQIPGSRSAPLFRWR